AQDVGLMRLQKRLERALLEHGANAVDVPGIDFHSRFPRETLPTWKLRSTSLRYAASLRRSTARHAPKSQLWGRSRPTGARSSVMTSGSRRRRTHRAWRARRAAPGAVTSRWTCGRSKSF